MNEIVVEREIGGKTLRFKTGMMAKQAAGAVQIQYGNTVVFSAVSTGSPRPGIDFFPLLVDYREKMYAAGKFPGGFFKRESRPSDGETLTMRLTDRPLRPLFPEGFRNEVVINGMVLSADGENDPAILSLTGAGAAVSISSIPFAGPVAGVRVGRVDGVFVINPTFEEREQSDLDLVIAGTKDAVTMVEAGAEELSEDVMIEALNEGHKAIIEICELIDELVEKAGKPKDEFVPEDHSALVGELCDRYLPQLKEALCTPGKFGRRAAAKKLLTTVLAEMATPDGEEGPSESLIKELWNEDVCSAAVRGMLKEEKKRVDGRGPADIRDIDTRVGMLPCTHGSSLFTRGETQAMAIVTLGTKGDEQTVEGLGVKRGEQFYLHYNFPGFCVGEAKPPRGPGRREIGHGALAQRGLSPVLPHDEGFPYTVRVVSEVLESNGSSSMATVCSGTLAMMDAGVPIRRPVAGIAMGLVKEGDDVIVLSDILGDEDHYGDMDFKVTGTQTGITALQMDIKCTGLSTEIMKAALEQAREGRIHILREMLKSLQRPREDISPMAPRIETIKIDPELIGKVIGPGGKTIRGIQEETGAKIDIEEDGTVMVSGVEGKGVLAAKGMIEMMTQTPEVGGEYNGEVKTIRDFGCFVEIAPGVEGMVHISELDHGYVKSVGDVVSVGEKTMVKIISIDDQGRIRLSRKACMPEPEGAGKE
ncbi:MAG: polyribonucleotide nucleotidyltransferase [Planctomycetota bacterium]